MSESKGTTVVVLGATSALGRALLSVLAKQEPSWIIRAVTRDPLAAEGMPELTLPTVQILQGNPLDRDSLQSVTADADIVFQCLTRLHPTTRRPKRYQAEHWPALIRNLLEKSGKTQKIIFAESLAAYDTTPVNASAGIRLSTAKRVEASVRNHTTAGLRSHLCRCYEEHMATKPHTIAVVCASDVFAPHVPSVLGSTFCRRLCDRRRRWAVGSADCIHDFCYLPDWAQALQAVAAASIATTASTTTTKPWDTFWMCPHAIQNKSLQQIAKDMDTIIVQQQQLHNHNNNNSVQSMDSSGNSERHDTTPEESEPSASTEIVEPHPVFGGVRVIPKLLAYTLTPFNPYISEVMERLATYQHDYHVDDSDFLEAFPNVPVTPYEQALQDYVAYWEQVIEDRPQKPLVFDDD